MADIISQSGSYSLGPSADNRNVNSHLFTFPPFPQPPDDCHITPFVEFKERGICVDPGTDEDDDEVDTLGIPTTMLKVEHNTDVCKTNTRRKRRAEDRARNLKAGQKVKKKEWWEVWEETEKIRYSKGLNPRSPRFERIQAATIDFSNPKERNWPPQTKSETGPKFIWEKFLFYIGLSEGYVPVSEKSQNKKKKVQEDEDSLSDDSDDLELPEMPLTVEVRHVGGGNKTTSEVHIKKVLTNEEKLYLFLDDPEKAIKIFMSSHAWAKGYIWSELNLVDMPRLLGFYVQFLLRNKVLPELDRQLRRSLESISDGLVQLPNSAAFMKIVPEKLGESCFGCWGKKAEGYTYANANPEIPTTDDPTTKDDDAKSPQLKKQKMDTDAPQAKSGENNEGGDSAWGKNEGWGGDIEAINAWSSDQLGSVIWEEEEKRQPLFDILGATAFPLTHTTGVVERSMRKVKFIRPLNNNPPNAQGSPEGGPVANSVEIDLDHYFSKVVLAPMPDWDNGEAPLYASPEILDSSRGPIVGVPQADASDLGRKPHDPFNDDITVLMESRLADLLLEGMGVGGTWVQLVRQSGQGTKKKKGKSKPASVYWYLEEVAFVTPSFWSFRNA